MLATITPEVINNAITFGTVLATIVAAIWGTRKGDEAKKLKPLDPTTSGIAAGFVDKDEMQKLRMACESIAGTLKAHLDIQTDEYEQSVKSYLGRIDERQERLEAALLKKHDDDDRANRTVDRTGERVDRTADRVMPSRRPKA